MTVPSMKARLDPRIVAARIHGSADFAQGEALDVVLIIASSQGFFKLIAIVFYGARAPFELYGFDHDT